MLLALDLLIHGTFLDPLFHAALPLIMEYRNAKP